MAVTKGAAENRPRPGIDPLFRSAAVSHGSRVIVIVLTGMLDDGTAGLVAVKRRGGVTVVQNPGLSLLASQSEKIEEMLWISLRMFEERKNLLTSLAADSVTAALKRKSRRQAKETQGYIDRTRAMLLDPRSDRPEDTLTRVKALMAEPRKAKSAR